MPSVSQNANSLTLKEFADLYGGPVTLGEKLICASAATPAELFAENVGTQPGLLVVGQSLSDGFGATDYTTAASAKHLMFNGGTRALHDTTLDVNKISSLTALLESVSGSSGQTCLTSALDYMTQLVAEKLGIPSTAQPAWVGATMTRSGQPITSFPSGQYPYTNSVEAAASMLRHAEAAGKTGGMKAIFWVQGESNNTGAAERATYKTALEALITSYLSGTGATVFCGYQTAGGMTSDLECLGSTLAQWDSFKAGNYNIVCPNYFLPDNGSVHINATGQAWMGAFLGRWLFDYFWRGVVRKPLYPTDVTRDGTLVTLTFAGNEGQLVLDTTNYYPVTDTDIAVSVNTEIAVSINTGTDVITATAHNFLDGDAVQFTAAVFPAGLAAATDYYVRDQATNTFKVAATLGGAAIDITTAGTTVKVIRNDAIMATAHDFLDGDAVQFTAAAFPAGLVAATDYYVRDRATNTFKVAATRGGAAIDITTAGTTVKVIRNKVKLGFSMYDGTTPVAIGTPTVVGTNQVTFTCPSSFVGTPTVRYAIDYRGQDWNRPARGAGNLRDSSTDRFTFRGYSLPLHNWAVHFDWTL